MKGFYFILFLFFILHSEKENTVTVLEYFKSELEFISVYFKKNRMFATTFSLDPNKSPELI